MKFIRDIISERSDAKQSRTPSVLPPMADGDAVPSDETSVTAPAAAVPSASRPAYRDRTMTRLSDSLALDDDDVFKRLLGEEAAASAEVDGLKDRLSAKSEPEFEDDTNLFDDLDDADDPDLDFKNSQLRASPSDVEAFNTPSENSDVSSLDSSEMLQGFRRTSVPPVASEPSMPEGQVADTSDDPTAFDLSENTQSHDHGAAFSGVPGRVSSQPSPADDSAQMMSVPAPASGRSGRGAGRVKTRLLGFGAPEAPMHDPFRDAQQSAVADTPEQPVASAPKAEPTFPVGWLVVTSGPGRGTAFALGSGVSQIGRGADQAVRLDFGDTSISRSNHAAIAFDEEQGGFYLGHGGKANMVRLNDRPVLSTEEISSGAVIRIGETTLRFIALCDGSFSWAQDGV